MYYSRIAPFLRPRHNNEFLIHYYGAIMDLSSLGNKERLHAWATDDFSGIDAVGQATLVRDRQVSPLELVDAAIRRIDAVNPCVNAIASTAYDQARERARDTPMTGLLAGVPTLLKDLLAYPGLKVEYGSRALAGQVAIEGSDYTAALDLGGLVVLGKTTTSELGLLGTTESLASGAARNPWNLLLSTGGSSGGAVAAVASGMVPVAHASDGGGSIRGPASFCGLFGFKPSRGRHLSTGPFSDTPFGFILSDHCVSRSVRDSAAWLAITERKNARSEYPEIGYVSSASHRRLRIGVYDTTAFGRSPDPEVARALERTMVLCEALGHDIIQSAGPVYPAYDTCQAFFTIAGAGAAGLMAQLSQADNGFDPAQFEPLTRELATRIGSDPASAMKKAFAVFLQAQEEATHRFDGLDVLLCPTVPFTAFPLGYIGPHTAQEDVIAFTMDLAGYTAIASIAGWCAMSVPLMTSADAMPIGMQFCAPKGQDERLLRLAYELEAAAPWQTQHP